MMRFLPAVAVAVAGTIGFMNSTDPLPVADMAKSRTHVVRLTPGMDLKKELLALAARGKIRAGVMLTCVGSLSRVSLRMANEKDATTRDGFFEIVSLVGMLDGAGSHLHLAVSDKSGTTIGGHLLEGNIVYTTAEVAVLELTDLEFSRELDPTHGYKELVVRRAK